MIPDESNEDLKVSGQAAPPNTHYIGKQNGAWGTPHMKIHGGNKALNQTVADLAGSLTDVERHIRRDDRREIAKGILTAVFWQEVTRSQVTGYKMSSGSKSSIDKDQLIECWRALAHHYRGARHQGALELGAEQLEKLSPAEAISVVYAIRREVEPVLNKEMETKQLRIGINVPILGQIGLGTLRWTARGPRVSIRKLRWRLVRLLVEIVVWTSAVLGTIHWIAWTIFNEPYLTQVFDGVAKLIQLFLLISTTCIVLGVARVVAKRKRSIQLVVRIGGWSFVAGGWSLWLYWVLFSTDSTLVVLEPVLKIGLVFCVLSAYLIGWLLRRNVATGNRREQPGDLVPSH